MNDEWGNRRGYGERRPFIIHHSSLIISPNPRLYCHLCPHPR